jgi:hypothetical protein
MAGGLEASDRRRQLGGGGDFVGNGGPRDCLSNRMVIAAGTGVRFTFALSANILGTIERAGRRPVLAGFEARYEWSGLGRYFWLNIV